MAVWNLFDDMFEPSFYTLADFLPRRTVPLRILYHPAEGEQVSIQVFTLYFVV